MNNCIYLHIAKTGGSTFRDHFEFVEGKFGTDLNPVVFERDGGNLIHMEYPAISLNRYCALHNLDFNELLEQTTFVLTLREPCDWIESFWSFIIKRELDYPHLLLPESQYATRDAFVNPLRFDKEKMEVNGISLDSYISRFKDMRESTFWEIVKHIRATHARYSSVNSFMRFHANPSSLVRGPLTCFDVSPFQGYSASDYAIKSYLFTDCGEADDHLYDRLNLFIVPTDSLDIFLRCSKDPLFFDQFQESGIGALHAKARKDLLPDSRTNVNKAKIRLSDVSRRIVEYNMSADVWRLKTIRKVNRQLFD